MIYEQQWHRKLPGGWSGPGEVHVWRVFLDGKTEQAENLSGWLSTDELERAGRFHFEKDRRRFVTARGMLRKILGHYLDESPQNIRFAYASFGKPSLSPRYSSDGLCFNVSHSDALALIAVAPGRNIGIDIERVRYDMDAGQMARRFFAPAEIQMLESLDESSRNALFFQYWTRKEAFIKGTGEGFSFPVEQLDVSLNRGRELSPVVLLGDQQEHAHWHVQDLFPAPGFVAAMAVEGSDAALSYWHAPMEGDQKD